MKTTARSNTTVSYYWVNILFMALVALIIFQTTTVAAPILNKNTQLIPSQTANIALKVAFDQLGKPYLYGSSGPSAFDCSGLILYSYQQAGIFLPHNAAKQQEVCAPIDFEDLLPGDLIFSINAQHVGMYIGNDKYIHSPETGEVVRIDTLVIGKKFFSACRPGEGW
jgi:cell wall-associated NlpC family hydrolase